MVDSKENNKFDLGVKWLTKVTMWFQQAPPPLISHLYQDILKRVGEGGGISQVCLGSTGLECMILTC